MRTFVNWAEIDIIYKEHDDIKSTAAREEVPSDSDMNLFRQYVVQV